MGIFHGIKLICFFWVILKMVDALNESYFDGGDSPMNHGE
jgi:hypothetical protein